MASRYALRELEGAIGLDCRTLRDGRKAEFLHTALYKRAKREFFERRDSIEYLRMSYMSVSCISANLRMDLDRMLDSVSRNRVALLSAMFPYVEFDADQENQKDGGGDVRYEDYEKYFDELDELEKSGYGRQTENGETENGVDMV